MDDFLKIHESIENSNFIIPIYISIGNNNFNVSNLLLDYGADINYILYYKDIITNKIFNNFIIYFTNIKSII